jgi:hypothetical protein
MEKGTRMRVNLLAVLAVAFVLALGGTALAQDTSPTGDAYGGVLGNEVENTADTTADTPPATVVHNEAGSPGSSLPFTGFQVGLVALVGIGLVALGFGMRRGTRRPAA